MTDLVSLDPSINSCGVAIFRDGTLRNAATVRAINSTDMPIAARCMDIAHEVLSWVSGERARVGSLVVEWPQVYRAARSPGNPNDLLPLAGVNLAVAGLLSMALLADSRVLEIYSYLPAEWAGQTPKAKGKTQTFLSVRAKRIAARLSVPELSVFGIQNHDGIDAIGIGLYHLGRLSPDRTFPGATCDTH